MGLTSCPETLVNSPKNDCSGNLKSQKDISMANSYLNNMKENKVVIKTKKNKSVSLKQVKKKKVNDEA
jgi:hypothetical protein